MLDREVGASGWLRQRGHRGRTPATIAARLTYEDVYHRYGEVESVSGFSLDVAPGEIVVLIGHSGCGKTTALRLAAGVELPSSGRILINDQEVAGTAQFLPPEQRGVGLMFQDYALFPHLTNLANVMFGLRGLPREDAVAEARLALDRVGLADYADVYPHRLSGGEQQRVALARAVAPRPSVLLMDEPFSGLDRSLRDEVREDTLAVLRESRVTCVIVTHDPEEALRMADRIALMRQGTLVQVDVPEAVYRRPADLFVARFFCELNEIPGVVRGGGVETPVGTFVAPDLGEGASAVVAIRPTGIRLRAAGSGLPGRLERRRFLGVVDMFEVAVNGIDRVLKGRTRETIAFTAKDEVAIEIDPAEVLVFAAPEA
ncbi:MAG TPA: ABC transporter ATP-binding protein [Xanthobacteraceae bacterium]|nr:ABC transporter ATP-binding protein [Xanthobacteraceae bacterium]